MPLTLSLPLPTVALSAAFALLLAGCATGASPTSTAAAPAASAAPVQMVATIRAAAGSGEGELAVAPLRDPMVEDLREEAHRLEQAGKHEAAAAALDRALQIVPDDPAMLQERAEVAVLLRDYAGAEQRARRAFELGSKVGPLCRRHWATIRAVRYAASDGSGAGEAGKQLVACKVAAVERF